MLNEDYTTEILGSGISTGDMEGHCPQAHHYRVQHVPCSLEWSVSCGQATDQSSTWCGTCLETDLQSFSFITPVEN
jgi:hypothetical protein